jgi:hypothetical protein
MGVLTSACSSQRAVATTSQKFYEIIPTVFMRVPKEIYDPFPLDPS